MSESRHREWKASWRDEYLKWICGFANAEGGVLTVGRDDTGNDVNLPEPVYQYNALDFEVTLLGKTLTKTTQETTQEKILALLRENPSITRKALAERIGITPDGIKYHLDKLKTAGIIQHSGPTKGGHWQVLGDDK
ncbi:MAG: putative HTH transcriptional regulator [Arenicella sp.]|jgi:predicted HTH transcriptional regulator